MGGPISAGGLVERVMGDSGQEMEIQDATAYSHGQFLCRLDIDGVRIQALSIVSMFKHKTHENTFLKASFKLKRGCDCLSEYGTGYMGGMFPFMLLENWN